MSLLLLLNTSVSFAQRRLEAPQAKEGALQFKVGDKVEAYSSYAHTPTNWGNATIIGVETNGNHKGPYHIHFDHGEGSEWEWLRVYEVRARAGGDSLTPNQPEKTATSGGSKNAVTNGGKFSVGDRVDVYYTLYTTKSGKGRGTVIEVGDGRYKIHYDGCKSYNDEWEDRMAVRSEATISASDPVVTFLIGNWEMFTPSYPNTVVRGGNIYREYGTGAKSPPLQINADGSYIWYFDFGKPPVRGKWTTHANVGERVQSAGMASRSVTDSGIIIKDPAGQEWKVYRWVMPDNKDRVTAHLMCDGLTMGGSRIR